MLEYGDYNTAVQSRDKMLSGSSLFASKPSGLLAFIHDVADGYDERFAEADAIYIQPPWPKGFASFDASKTYQEFVEGCKAIIDACSVPTFAILGNSMVKTWEPQRTSEVLYMFHGGYPSVLGVWNYDGDIEFGTEVDVARFCIKSFDCILDFLAGYGNTAKWAIESGKKCICADISQECIDYING